MTFISTSWQPNGADEYEVHGDLTIRGTTRPVTVLVTENGTGVDPWGNTRLLLSARATIDRKEFGLTWNQALETGGVLVGDEIKVEIEVQAIQAEKAESNAA